MKHKFDSFIKSSLHSNTLELDISNQGIKSLDFDSKKISNVSIIDAGNNKIASLPKEISQLKNLITLNLWNNEIDVLPAEIGELVNLTTFNIWGNNLSTLPPEVEKMSSLTTLNLRNNRITTVPAEIGYLPKLKTLILSDNLLTELPTTFIDLSKRLYRLDLRGNKLPIPPEILEQVYNPQAVVTYYFSLLEKRKPINELKLLVVGQGSVGKTSIIQRLTQNTNDLEQKKTDGIRISHWELEKIRKTSKDELSTEDNSIKINFWDFGGQEIMHATHQFFLTKRSLYMLVLDARLSQEENRTEYWMKLIQSLGGDSPIIIVGNKVDQHPLDIDYEGLKKKYSNIAGVFSTSAKVGTGVYDLQKGILELVSSNPQFNILLPENWFSVKLKLEKLKESKSYITLEEYYGICQENDIKAIKEQKSLLFFLHDIGILLYFQDNPRLEALGVLNPEWVTNGVYRILNSHYLFQRQGVLSKKDLDLILPMSEYPNGKKFFIMDLMKNFELCYEIDTDQTYLIPDLLPKSEPYTGDWEEALAFQIHYDILPSSIMSRFIVRLNKLIYKSVWRQGVVLRSKDETNYSLVKADLEERIIYIFVKGMKNTRRDFLAFIRMELQEVNSSIPKIQSVEKVPVPRFPTAHPIEYNLLIQLEEKHIFKHHVKSDNRLIEVDVRNMLNGVDPDDSRILSYKNTIQIHGDLNNSAIIIGDNNEASINQDIFEPIYVKVINSTLNADEKESILEDIAEIENEITNKVTKNNKTIIRRLRNFKKISPRIANELLNLMENSSINAYLREIAKQIKSEASNS